MLDIIINNEIVNSGDPIGRNEHGFVSTQTHKHSKFEGQTPTSVLRPPSLMGQPVDVGTVTDDMHNQNSNQNSAHDTAKMDQSIEEELARAEEYVNSKILESRE